MKRCGRNNAVGQFGDCCWAKVAQGLNDGFVEGVDVNAIGRVFGQRQQYLGYVLFNSHSLRQEYGFYQHDTWNDDVTVASLCSLKNGTRLA